jgi:putative membrane protein
MTGLLIVATISLALLAPPAWWYAAGASRLHGTLRDRPRLRRRYQQRMLCLVSGVVILLAVTVSPAGEALEERFSTHMAQHVVIIVVVAPLLALAAPGQVVLVGMPAGLRRGVVRRVRRLPTLGLLTPHVAWMLHIGTLWLWHLPSTYDAAVASEPVHLLEHATFLLTAWLFWWHLATAARRRLRGPAAALYVVSAIPPGAALGAVLTFPDHLLYPGQAALAAATGIDPLLDQRIAGLVMWVPLDFLYLGLAIALFGRWLSALPQRTDQEAGEPALPSLPTDSLPVPLEVR